ncbi:hypothetical protein CFRS1_v013598 [Colletotrichum fructicola]|nr:hypothetical protein CFRS1_v013598 [Colletotrichum fructicola]
MTIFQLFDLVITGYVDDITILLASSSYELNCEALAQVYRRLTRFTSLHGTEFSADKTQVIHLCQSRKAPPIVNVMPNVSGFPTEAKDDAIKVLGLHLDYQLKWNVHMAHTLAKVRQKMYQMRRVCGSTWGPDVLKLRHQYITSVRPIFAYACALWYVVRRTKGTRCKWSLCQALVNKLETEQTQCLKQFFGAYQRVSGDTLCKEFFVEKLCVSLAGSHPLNVAYREAKALVWMVADDELQLRIRADPKLAKNSALRRLRRKQLIRDVVKKMSHFKSQDLWQKFVIRYLSQAAAFNENCPAIQGIWGQHNLKIWVDMPKAQSTILLHIRTGFNGLNATLHFMGLRAPSIRQSHHFQRHFDNNFMTLTWFNYYRPLCRRHSPSLLSTRLTSSQFYSRQQRPRCHWAWSTYWLCRPTKDVVKVGAMARISSKRGHLLWTARQDVAMVILSAGLCILKGVVLLIAARLALWSASILASWGVPRAKPCGMRPHGSGRMEHIVKESGWFACRLQESGWFALVVLT